MTVTQRGIRTHDLANDLPCSNQLSYRVTCTNLVSSEHWYPDAIKYVNIGIQVPNFYSKYGHPTVKIGTPHKQRNFACFSKEYMCPYVNIGLIFTVNMDIPLKIGIHTNREILHVLTMSIEAKIYSRTDIFSDRRLQRS